MTREELELMRTEAWKNNDWQLAARVQMVLDKLNGLVDAATTVRDRLTRLIDGLTNEGVLLDLNLPRHSFNTLGEVQGSGSEVDRLCGELGIAIDLLKELKRDRADATKPEHQPTPAELGEAAAREEAAASRKPTAIGVREARAMGRQARKLGRPIEQALTGDEKVDARIREGYEAAGKEPKTYPVTDRRGRSASRFPKIDQRQARGPRAAAHEAAVSRACALFAQWRLVGLRLDYPTGGRTKQTSRQDQGFSVRKAS